MSKPNILFILVDCLRADVLDHPLAPTVFPTIHTLMKRGACFNKMFAVSSQTTPAVASILTGNYPNNHGLRTLKQCYLSPGVKTLPQLLSDQGYKTTALVTGPLFQENGINLGYDIYEWREPYRYLHAEWDEYLKNALINHNKTDCPWFIFLHLWELHHPKQISADNKAKYHGMNNYYQALSSLDVYLQGILNEVHDNTLIFLTGDHGENISSAETTINYLKRFVPKNVFVRNIIRRVAQLLAKYKNTTNVKEVFHIGHGYALYDYLINVPFILSLKKLIPSSLRISTQVSQVDVLPTTLDLLGISPLDNIDGRSLVPFLEGQEIPPVPIYLELNLSTFPDPRNLLIGVRTPDFKFIERPFNSDCKPLLFDLRVDPLEKTNVFDKNNELLKVARDAMAQFPTPDLAEYKSSKQTLSSQEEQEISEKLKSLGYMG